jgi:hypothetical protein
MDDFLLPTIEQLFRYFDDHTFPMVPAGERLLDAERQARAADVGRARTRWLDEHHAERSFPCGVVRWEASITDGVVTVEVFVTAVVTDTSVVFLVDRPDGSGREPIEVGSIDRPAIDEVTVVDLDGRELLHAASEPIDPEPEVVLVIRWRDTSGASWEQRLLFGSVWEAWRAADTLRAAMPPDRLSM